MPKKGKKNRRKIRPRNGEQTYYIDTDHIISYLFEEKDQTFIARGLFGAIFSLNNPQIKVIIPNVAIGEVVNELKNQKYVLEPCGILRIPLSSFLLLNLYFILQ